LPGNTFSGFLQIVAILKVIKNIQGQKVTSRIRFGMNGE
jgi:hypothetical protein